MLSPLQERKISRMFQVLDTDGNGYVTTADSDRVVVRLVSQRNWTQGGAEHQALSQAYQRLSQAQNPFRDAEGRIDREAYLGFHRAMLSQPGAFDATVRGLADFMFDVLDADADGRVSQEELRAFYSAYSIDTALAPDAFRKMDADSDGLISKSEILEALKEFYYSDDANAPGNWFLGSF